MDWLPATIVWRVGPANNSLYYGGNVAAIAHYPLGSVISSQIANAVSNEQRQVHQRPPLPSSSVKQIGKYDTCPTLLYNFNNQANAVC